MKKRVLITGASGQIGTNLAEKLQKEGYEVLGLDKRLNTWTQSFLTIIQDLSCTYDCWRDGLGNVDYGHIDLVVHLAANAKVHELTLNPSRARDNFLMTFNILEYCRCNKIPIIFGSTREVYGDIKRYETNEQQADFLTTESPYSASKISGEAFIYSYCRCYDLKYLVFRFSNVYGRYDNDIDRMERVIPLFFKKISNDEPLVIYGKNKTLDFTYIDDCISGIFSGVEKLLNGQMNNKTFNLAYGLGHSLKVVVEEFEKFLNHQAQVRYEESRLGEVIHYVADLTQAKKYLGYKPKTPFKQGLYEAAKWYAQYSC